jgi:hypothetical protein
MGQGGSDWWQLLPGTRGLSELPSDCSRVQPKSSSAAVYLLPNEATLRSPTAAHPTNSPPRSTRVRVLDSRI